MSGVFLFLWGYGGTSLWLFGSIILEDVNKIDKLDIPNISGVEFGFLESAKNLEIIDSFVKR